MQYNRYLKARTRRFETEWFPLIGIQDPVDESSCDAVVVGSDEVFNISPDAKWGVSYQSFGDVHCDCTISYACSFANTTYEDLCALNIEKRIAAAMNKFKAISTRDSASEQDARILTNRDVSIHLDPVLVGDFNAIVPNSIPYKDYILVYSYDNRIHETSEVKAIKRFAKRYNKKLISFGFYQNWCDKNILVDPFTLMACFRNASYVVTDTFHGTVLSIKHNRPFTAFIRDSNRNKITDLVTRLHLENRVVVAPQELKSVLESNIDYDSVNKRLAMERKRSLEYLYRNLG